MNGRTALALLAIGALAALAAVQLGLLDRFTADGVDPQVKGVIFVYWFAASVVLWLVDRWRIQRADALLSLAALILSLGFAEAALRGFSLFPQATLMRYHGLRSATLHHVLPANATMYYRRPGRQSMIVRTNEDGLRSEYSPRAFASFKTRIIALGDSQTFGLGVGEAEAYPKVMERLLRDRLRSDDLAVLNAGQVSYSPLLEWRSYLTELRAYRPTHVLLMVDPTDIGDDYAYLQESVDRQGARFPPGPDRDPYVYRGALWEMAGPYFRFPLRFLHLEGPDPYRYDAFSVTVGGVVERNRFFIYRHPLDETRPFFLATWEHLNRLAEALAQDGVRFTVGILPRYHHWNPRECPANWEQREYTNAEPFQFEYMRFFDEMGPTAGFGVFDTLPAFQATREFPLVFENDPHFNARGHAFLARVLADHLIDEHRLN